MTVQPAEQDKHINNDTVYTSSALYLSLTIKQTDLKSSHLWTYIITIETGACDPLVHRNTGIPVVIAVLKKVSSTFPSKFLVSRSRNLHVFFELS